MNYATAENKRRFGSNVRELRRAKGMNQKDLATKLKIGVSRLSHWERGRFTPRFEELLKLLRVLEVEVEDLFKGVRK